MAGILAIYRNGASSPRTDFRFMIGKLLQGTAWLLLSLRGQIPDLFSAHLGNTILLSGFAIEALAITTIEKPNKLWEIIYTIIVSLFIIIFWVLAKNANQYVYVASIFSAFIFLTVSVLLVRSTQKSVLRNILSGLYALASTILVIRSLNAFFVANFGLMTSNFIQTLTFSTTYFLMILSGSSFLLLLRERSDKLLSEANSELNRLIRVDSLTNLANRRAFDERLLFSIMESRRRAEPLTLIMIDIDFFKNFNDLYGHSRGDQCLVQVAQQLESSIRRGTDFVARYGGEEFAMILLDTDASAACHMAEKIRQEVFALGIPHGGSNVAEHVTISLGAFSAKPTSEAHDCDWYIDEADRRLYEAKHVGRNRSVCNSKD